jgi:hypothetical protein
MCRNQGDIYCLAISMRKELVRVQLMLMDTKMKVKSAISVYGMSETFCYL